MTEPRFAKGDTVLFRRTNDVGEVRDDPKREAGEYWYRVRFATRSQTIPEEELTPLADDEETLRTLATSGKWGKLDAVRCALAIERIKNANRSTVYAFQNQRILFQPYQYKPLLKVLDSHDRRLLIADEVGLGKTIEAGLILTELDARKSLDSVMVVCPSRLREKWQNELNRKFDQDFEVFDRQSFEQTVRRFHERPGRVRLRGIMSMQAMRSERVRDILTAELGTLDLVIVDEAHHARNMSTSTSKLLRDLCEISDSVILLTATPVQLNNSDLFTLLNALRPTEFRDAWAFEQSLSRHAGLHVASGLARTQDQANLQEIIRILNNVFLERRLAEQVDPLARQLIDEIQSKPPNNREDWIGLERRIQDLHPLGTILTRTKKKDVLENAPERVARCYKCEWTTAEDEAYQRLVESSGSCGWPSSSLSFGQVTRARQAASCLPAAYEKQVLAKVDDDATELTDILPSDLGPQFRDDDRPSFFPDRWEGVDSKYETFRQILDTVWQSEPTTKILVFTFFKGTARYLERRLTEAGKNVLRIDGDVKSDPRQPEKDERGKRIRKFETDPEVQVMVSTEVGSEGLDFQFCHHVVNYDLPWNPMVVEQRIGRIDRFGQKSDKVFIHNLVVSGTVEERILERLYRRIGIFENSIGALEAILGDTMKSLQKDYLGGNLTQADTDRRVEQAANAIVQRQKDMEVLEQKASQLFGHEEYVLAELQRVRKLGQFIGDSSLLSILRTYFRVCHPNVKIKTESEEAYAIKVTDDLRMDIQDAAREKGSVWHDRSRDGILHFTTSGEKAFESSDLELVNAQHPLVLAAIEKLSKQMDQPTARLGAAVVVLSREDRKEIPEGDYFLILAPITVYGIRNRRLIEIVAKRDGCCDILNSDASQRLLYLTTESGCDWSDGQPPSLTDSEWDILEDDVMRRTRLLKENEKGENNALYVRRRNAMIAEHEHEMESKLRRLTTAQSNNEERAIKLFKAQIEKAEARHRGQLDSLEQQQTVTVTAGDPIAACIVRVVHETDEGH